MPNSPPHPQELQRFNADIYDLLQSQNPQGRALFSFIRRSLRQFALEGIYIETDVFNEAYKRGVKAIQAGTTIQTPRAWMRTTTLNVIREWNRLEKRCQAVEADHLDYLETPQVFEEVIEQDIHAVLRALSELEEDDRLLIHWRAIEALSWRDISHRLVEAGERMQTEQTLRKRGQRAMQRLRHLYHTIRPPKTLVP